MYDQPLCLVRCPRTELLLPRGRRRRREASPEGQRRTTTTRPSPRWPTTSTPPSRSSGSRITSRTVRRLSSSKQEASARRPRRLAASGPRPSSSLPRAEACSEEETRPRSEPPSRLVASLARLPRRRPRSGPLRQREEACLDLSLLAREALAPQREDPRSEVSELSSSNPPSLRSEALELPRLLPLQRSERLPLPPLSRRSAGSDSSLSSSSSSRRLSRRLEASAPHPLQRLVACLVHPLRQRRVVCSAPNRPSRPGRVSSARPLLRRPREVSLVPSQPLEEVVSDTTSDLGSLGISD